MEDSKELKNNLDQTANTEEVKHIIAQAGKKLTDDEVGEVAGGYRDDGHGLSVSKNLNSGGSVSTAPKLGKKVFK
ncbi:MAG: hypothetical protein IKH28_00780 [Lachnospiraceae bacterium]|nr:hypothetical protein [Lachnospiraceae bacterium]